MAYITIRDGLINLPDGRLPFYGVLARFGLTSDGSKKTVCIENIHLDYDDTLVTSHCWFDFNNELFDGLMVDDLVFFEAEVAQYRKGAKKNVDDLKLDKPEHVKLLYRLKR